MRAVAIIIQHGHLIHSMCKLISNGTTTTLWVNVSLDLSFVNVNKSDEFSVIAEGDSIERTPQSLRRHKFIKTVTIESQSVLKASRLAT